MTHLGLWPTVYVVVMAVLTFRNVPATHVWPFANLCPQRGTFPMIPGCRVFCLCYRPGGAGRLLACPEDHRFNPEQERCTNDPEVCEEKKLCDSPALLEKAEELHLKELKTECDNTGMTYCANRWELVVCHPVWSHMLGVIECDRNGDGGYICNVMTDTCEKNRTGLWESSGIDAVAFGTPPGEDCEVGGDDEYPEASSDFFTPCCPPTLCRTRVSEPAQTTSSTTPTTTTQAETSGEDYETQSPTTLVTVATPPSKVPEDEDTPGDPCELIDHYPNAECRKAGSWCLPDLETIVTCGEQLKIRQVRSCREAFGKEGLNSSCFPIVFGCVYWPEKVTPGNWSSRSVEPAGDDRRVESYGAWFREHWCKSHGMRGYVCTPDGNYLAHCNESLMVDSMFRCDSAKPERLLLGCQYCEPGTSICVYRPRAELADNCGKPGPKDNHEAACGFFIRGRRRPPAIRVRRGISVPYSAAALLQVKRTLATGKKLEVTKHSML